MTLEVASIPLGLYIHIPWCVRKCPYCDFNSHEAASPPWPDYVAALLADIESDQALTSNRTVTTVFIGGGTPSLMPGREMQSLLGGIRARIEISQDAEITLEANPGTTDAAHFADYAHAGVNRISVGAQSFRDRQLRALGRIHGSDAIGETVAAARSAGIDNINIDLMHNLPDDDPKGSRYDLERALSLQPEHVSWYELTLEPGTAFMRKPPSRPQHDEIVDATEAGIALLAANGYDRYEVSAFAKPDKQARHNLNYWRYGDYLGIGAGAHGKLSHDGNIYRTEKRRSPGAYIRSQLKSADPVPARRLDDYEIASDFMINALRLSRGFPRSLFEQRTGLPIESVGAQLASAKKRGMLLERQAVLTPTEQGYRFLTDLQMLFVGENAG